MADRTIDGYGRVIVVSGSELLEPLVAEATDAVGSTQAAIDAATAAADSATDAAQAAATAAAAVSAIITTTTSSRYDWKVAYSDGSVPLGLLKNGMVNAPWLGGAVADFSRYKVGGAEITSTESSRYIFKIAYSGGEVAFGVTSRGDFLVDGKSVGSVSPFTAPTLTATYARSAYLHFTGQSLCVGRGSIKPADLFAVLAQPVLPGRVLMYGSGSPRPLGATTGDLFNVRIEQSALMTLGDAKEAFQDPSGATSAWTMARGVAAALPAEMVFVTNTAIGGTNIQTNRGLPVASGGTAGSRMATNRRAAIIAYAEHCRLNSITPFAPAVLIYDQDNANRTDTYQTFYDQLAGIYDDFRSEVSAEGGDLWDTWLVCHSGAGIYSTVAPSSPIAEVALNLARTRADAICWGPGYILESATGPYAIESQSAQIDGAVPPTTGDMIHLAAIGEARKGHYQSIYLAQAMAGTKRLPLHVPFLDTPASATVTAGGLVTLTYSNWRGSALALDTSAVTDPAATDSRLPYGFGYAPGLGQASGAIQLMGAAPSATKRPRASSFAIAGQKLSFQLEDIASGAAVGPDANPYINVAAFWAGAQQNGPDRGARACLRNNGSADDLTIATTGASYLIRPHDYAMPQRIPLQLV